MYRTKIVVTLILVILCYSIFTTTSFAYTNDVVEGNTEYNEIDETMCDIIATDEPNNIISVDYYVCCSPNTMKLINIYLDVHVKQGIFGCHIDREVGTKCTYCGEFWLTDVIDNLPGSDHMRGDIAYNCPY